MAPGAADPGLTGLADRGWVASDRMTADDLQERPWGATDGQVVDRHGVHWLVGFEGDATDGAPDATDQATAG